MTQNAKRSAGIALVALAALLTACGSSDPAQGGGRESTSPTAAPAAQLKRLPPFRLRTPDRREVSSDDFRGKVLLVNYWATWCAPCEKEMPGLQELQDRYAARGVAVVGIAMDTDTDAVRRFARGLGITYTLLIGTTDYQEKLGLLGLPSTFFVDRDGVIRRTVIGFEYKEKVEAYLKELL